MTEINPDEASAADKSKTAPAESARAPADSKTPSSIFSPEIMKHYCADPDKKLDPEKTVYPTVTINGAFQVDAGWFDQSPRNIASVGDVPDGADFRRARLTARGAVIEYVDYVFQMDFAFPGRPTFTDVYFDLKDIPAVGNIRVGQWKQYFGLEEITSYRFNPFLERASIFLLKPFRRTGIGMYDYSESENATWAVSTFRGGNDQYGGDIGDAGGAAMAARATFNPVYEDDGKKVLHFGADYWMSDPATNTLQFGAFGGNAPEFGLIFGSTITPSFVDTGIINTNIYNAFLLESALVYGRFSAQTEVIYTYLSQIGGTPLGFYGGYAYFTYYLTGEHRVYLRKFGAFDRVVPLSNFNPKKGKILGGAWETGARFSYINLNDGNIQGGALSDVTYALNWYLNPYLKLSFNYIHAFLDRAPVGTSDADVFAIRGQLDF